MTFFSDGNSEYFTLSGNPTGNSPAYVFRLTKKQLSVISSCLPLCFSTAIGTTILVVLFGIIDHFGIIRNVVNESQKVNIVCSLAAIAFMMVMVEVFLFLWIRFTPSSLLDQGERIMLNDIKLSRNLSLMTYASFFFAILVPLFGLFIIPGGFAGNRADFSAFGLEGLLILAPVGAGACFLLYFLIRRFRYLFGH